MRTATFVTTKGSFTVTLMPEHAPKTVANFVDLATGRREWTGQDGTKTTAPLYPGMIFHRVIDGFMIQGGESRGHGPRRPRLPVPRRMPSWWTDVQPGWGAWPWRTRARERTARSSSLRSERRRG